MKLLLVAVCLCFGFSAGLSKYRVPQWPTLGNPVHCLSEESYKDPIFAAAAQQCSTSFCSCMGGTQTDVQSMQCNTGMTGKDMKTMKMNTMDCAKTENCYPDYLTCLNRAAPGCAWAAQQQCEETVQVSCNEGKICRVDKIPGGISAGGIFAISAGILYLIAFVLMLGMWMSAKKANNKPVVTN
eukprot:NODE_2107_length_764_cov_335.300699_g1695_i0.p1 GENE.NODE_2107_length_764_cov_335.300699_g1695_i0~~NODE_2107_length_764_cov_335.300699_g1695_i0.p1  ORF type:complete len:201 (+),score=47.59 NODE_2107_length_764_cov_335.300699_g1695_i0:54-605(+)